MNTKEEKIAQHLQEHFNYLIKKGYEVVFLALQGSQNYGLDVYDEDYISDIDSKAVILPSIYDIVKEKEYAVSETIVLENNEHIDVKDIRVMFNTYKKQNINFIETLFSDYKIVNLKYEEIVQELFDNAEEVAHINVNQAIRCMSGMSSEKLNALKHPYPTIIDKIEKYGYDPKQLHHILRMNDFIKKYIAGKPYKECLIPDNKQYLIDIKKGIMPLAEAEKLANEVDADTHRIKIENTTSASADIINIKGLEILENVKSKLMIMKFREELKEEK